MKKLSTILLTVLACCTFVQQAFAVSYNLEAIRLYNMGLELYKKGAYKSAINSFKGAIEIQKDFYDAYYNMAIVQDFLGSTNEAISSLNMLLKQNPEDFPANLKIAQIYHKKGDVKNALEYANKIPPSAPEYDKARDLISRIHIETGASIKNIEEEKKDIAAKVMPIGRNILGINSPSGITEDKSGNVYVASYSDNAIFKVMPNNVHQLYSKSPLINGPIGIAFDSKNNMYIANYNQNNVLKIDKYGKVSVFIEFSNRPYYLFISNDMLYVGEQGSNIVMVRDLTGL